MDTASQHAISLLETLAMNNAKIISFVQQLRSRVDIKKALQQMDCRHYNESQNIFLEIFVDVEMDHNLGMTWWIDVSWTSSTWLIELRVSVNTPQGQDTIHTFPDKTARTLSEFTHNFNETIDELVGSAYLIDVVYQTN